MSSKFKWIWSISKLSFYAHHDQFDVIRPVNGYDIGQVRFCWFVALGLYIFTVLYGIFGLECESRPSCDIDWASLPLSPFNFYHQMFPKAVWGEVNFLALSVWVLCIGSWIGLLANPPIERRFLIPLDAGGNQDNDSDELKQMCKFRGPFLKFVFAMEIVCFPFAILFCYVHVFSINANYKFSLTSALFWGLLNPFHMYYIVIFLYSTPLYVILSSRYMTIQQKALNNKMIHLNGMLSKIRGPNLALRRAYHDHLWLQYLSLNIQICDLCKHVREYARFWSPYLTLLFMTFISVQCYAFYMVLFVAGLQPVLRFALMLAALGVVFDQFVLISQCAAVVKQFKSIVGQNQTFFRCYVATKGIGKILARNLIKAESLQNSRLLHSYAFRIFGNYRITNKSFHIIISYVSIFFLYIVKNSNVFKKELNFTF